jgi:hypothetical protein
MLLLERIVSYAATIYARRLAWSPVGKRVLLYVRESRDVTLEGQTLRGVISGLGADADGVQSKGFIDLDAKLNYFGHYRRGGIQVVRTAATRRWQGLERLLILPPSSIAICTTTLPRIA